jgi:hypothetical protein
MPNNNDSQNAETKKDEDDFFLANEFAEDYSFADHVKVTSFPHGMIFYFGKWYPERKKFGIYKSFVLPFHVAHSLSRIIQNQLSHLVKKGLIEKMPEDEET